MAITNARRYERGDATVVLVDARWLFRVEVLYQSVETETREQWFVIDEIGLAGQVQIYVPESEGDPGPAQFVSAQLSSDTSVSFHEGPYDDAPDRLARGRLRLTLTGFARDPAAGF